MLNKKSSGKDSLKDKWNSEVSMSKKFHCREIICVISRNVKLGYYQFFVSLCLTYCTVVKVFFDIFASKKNHSIAKTCKNNLGYLGDLK